MVEVHLPNTAVTDADLAAVARWTALRVLDLSGTKITDAGMRPLHALDNPHTLRLAFTDLNGGGLRWLSTLRRLQVLDLRASYALISLRVDKLGP